MTNKEAQITINAIKFMLDNAQYSEDVEEALNMATNVLTAQTETHDKRIETHARDCISRQAAISLPVKPKEDRYFQTQNLDDAYDYGWRDLQGCIEKMPSVQPEIIDWQAIEQLRESGWMQNHDKQMHEMGLREQLADDSDSYDALLPSAQPELARINDCNGCKFIGCYDTDFPCANCVRKDKDYYEPEE